jgi:Nuclease subunit of the excinuclease complex
MIPSPSVLDPRHPELPEQIQGIPKTPGVYLLTPRAGTPYLGWSSSLSRRLSRLLLRTGDAGRLSDVRQNLAAIHFWLTGSRLETSLLLYGLARQYDPENYEKRLKLRPPWFVSLLEFDPYPRLSVQNSIPRQPAATFGPFLSRDAADAFCQETSGLFQIRRCSERLAVSADHPGCMYGEMNLCMRPCQLAVSQEEYAAEVARVRNFLETNGRHQLALLMAARDRASQETDFEQAARLHKQLEKVKAVGGLRDNVVCEVNLLNGLALTRGSGPRSVALWPMLAGYWQPPLRLDFSQPESQAKSLDRALRDSLATHLQNPCSEGIRVEEIALLARWYFSSWRDGDWFSFRGLEDLNYRKLVRGISNLLRDMPAPGP